MFEVLLVDDEALARNDLKGMLDWEKHGFTVCGEAHNGAAALSIMERHPPHIVFIDVSMPVMNGVELSRLIRERFPRVKMIMLSSFDDYDYVRTCLKNGAMDYLLKHRLDAAALLSLLTKAAQDLQSEERELEARSAQTQMIERLIPAIHREHVANLARNMQDAGAKLEVYARDKQLYADSVLFGTAAVQIVPFHVLTESLSDVEKNRLVQQATDVMQMAVGDIQQRTVAYVGEGRFIILFSSAERSEHAASSQINHLLSSLSHSLEKFLNMKCFFAIGSLCGNLKQLAMSYSKADKEINDRLYQGLNPSKLRESLLVDEHKQLLLFLEQLDGERTSRVISGVFATVKDHPVYSMPVQFIVCELLRIAEMAARRFASPAFMEDQELVPSRSGLGRLGSVAEVEEWILAAYARILETLKKHHGAGPYSRHIAKAVQYITEHYASDISLEMTASALSLNPSYLSRLFKEETQMTFTEYLTRIRIKTSCVLMESGPYSLKEISGQVGFSNYTYFFRVFKSITGMTPQAYMDNLKPSKK
ncbi:response regulator [Paenibacillus sp. YN15]|uniref:response regulator n=1 Tax=Paenibacillus sp. YN15 TaxID=1742774 RepID=UPI000DCBD4CE|nr:response regulator [Paenibacillus sp. YN15]RAV06364.1 DNA-binding response regulator [Paenibacillus sp. YN15]